MPEGFIKYLVIIIGIMGLVFLSQQALVGSVVKDFVYKGADIAKSGTQRAYDWAVAAIYPKFSTEAQKRGEVINEQVSQQKENISNVSNYFSGISDSIFDPEKIKPCQNESLAK